MKEEGLGWRFVRVSWNDLSGGRKHHETGPAILSLSEESKHG